MNMICPSMPIPAPTELIEFLYISCCKKNYRTFLSAAPLCWRPGGIYHCLLPAALRTSYPKHTFKFGLLCFCCAIDITYKMKFRFAESIQCCIVYEVTVTRYIYLSNLAVKQSS